ncbi:hypothetical protein AG1IA_05675 [Rhizoctonia solani AG-1 IA]|uniref:Uncharacterized protein n=1 Tax=Thanatephorus cucumeris (strain AG1-IA) TaxID=983506 RepID=L8WQ95_THACA|nr:hypothetical protein AG1IA_05675 [Rhizoctonia solani AG-1 IA]
MLFTELIGLDLMQKSSLVGRLPHLPFLGFQKRFRRCPSTGRVFARILFMPKATIGVVTLQPGKYDIRQFAKIVQERDERLRDKM